MKKEWKIFFILIVINVFIAIGLIVHWGSNSTLDVIGIFLAITLVERQILGLVFYKEQKHKT
jgi:hypothetical protein